MKILRNIRDLRLNTFHIIYRLTDQEYFLDVRYCTNWSPKY